MIIFKCKLSYFRYIKNPTITHSVFKTKQAFNLTFDNNDGTGTRIAAYESVAEIRRYKSKSAEA